MSNEPAPPSHVDQNAGRDAVTWIHQGPFSGISFNLPNTDDKDELLKRLTTNRAILEKRKKLFWEKRGWRTALSHAATSVVDGS